LLYGLTETLFHPLARPEGPQSTGRRPALRGMMRMAGSMSTTTPGGMHNSLRDRGVRLTRQRRLLLDLIDRSGRHLDAESLFHMAREQDPKLNRVTVYRTLRMLKESGLVDELAL